MHEAEQSEHGCFSCFNFCVVEVLVHFGWRKLRVLKHTAQKVLAHKGALDKFKLHACKEVHLLFRLPSLFGIFIIVLINAQLAPKALSLHLGSNENEKDTKVNLSNKKIRFKLKPCSKIGPLVLLSSNYERWVRLHIDGNLLEHPLGQE